MQQLKFHFSYYNVPELNGEWINAVGKKEPPIISMRNKFIPRIDLFFKNLAPGI